MAFRECGVCGCLRRDLTSIIPSRQVVFQGGNTPVVQMDHRDRKKTRMCGACALEHLQGPYFCFKYQRKEQGEQGVNSQETEWTRTHPFRNQMWRFADADRRFTYNMQKGCGLFSIPSDQDARLGEKYVNDTYNDRLENWCSGVGLTNLWTISENPALNEFSGKEFWFPVARLPITAKDFADDRIAAVERVSFEEGSDEEARQPLVPGIWHGSRSLREEGRDFKFSFDPITKEDLPRNVGDAAREAYPKKRRIKSRRNITVVSAKGVEVGDEGETVHPKMDVTVQVFVHESGEMFNLTVKFGEVENLKSEFRHGLMRFCLVARPPTRQAKGTFHQVPKRPVAHVFSSSNCIGVSPWGISEKYPSDFNKEHKPPEGPFYHPFPHLNDWFNGSAAKLGYTANPRLMRSAAQRESVKCDIDERFKEEILQDGILVAPYAVEDLTTRSVRIPIPPGFQASFLQLVNGGVMTMKKTRDDEGGEKYEFEWNEGKEDPSLVLYIFLGACNDLRAETFLKDSPTGARWVNPVPLERVGRWAGGKDRMKVLTEDEKKAFDNREEGICKSAEDILPRPAPDSETANYYARNAWLTSIYKETWTAGMDPSWKEVLDKFKNPVKRAKLNITV